MQKQTDNHNLPAKLALRLHFLHQYHLPATANVLDCCMGTGKIWSEIRKEYQISQYWGVDLKPKKGRIKIDSAKILNQPGWKQDVIDVDTYGSPWEHWEAILKYATKPITVFLTIVRAGIAGSTCNSALRLLGVPQQIQELLPSSLRGKLSEKATDLALAKALTRYRMIEVKEAVSDGNARYIGVRLEPKTGGELQLPAINQNEGIRHGR